MFLLSPQNTIFRSYLDGHVKKNSSLNFMSSVGFQVSKIWMFFGTFIMEPVLKSFFGRHNSPNPSVFGFCDSLPFGLKESRE